MSHVWMSHVTHMNQSYVTHMKGDDIHADTRKQACVTNMWHHSYVWHCSHVCGVTHSCVSHTHPLLPFWIRQTCTNRCVCHTWHHSYLCGMAHSYTCGMVHSYMCDMVHSYMFDMDPYMCDMAHSYMCDMAHSYMSHITCVCLTHHTHIPLFWTRPKFMNWCVCAVCVCVSRVGVCACVKCHIVNTYDTGWQRPTGCLNLQVIFGKRATNYRALLRKMTYKDKASYASSPPCIIYMCFVTYSYVSHALPPPQCWTRETLTTWRYLYVWIMYMCYMCYMWVCYMCYTWMYVLHVLYVSHDVTLFICVTSLNMCDSIHIYVE